MLKKIPFEPGIVADEPELFSEGRFVAGNNMRHNRGLFEPLGGWSEVASGLLGKARGAYSFTGGTGRTYIAIGTHRRLYAWSTSGLKDITPGSVSATETLTFSLGVGESLATVTLEGHELVVGQLIRIANASGEVFGIDVNGEFEVEQVINADSFVIDLGTTPGVPLAEEDGVDLLEEDGTELLLEVFDIVGSGAGDVLVTDTGAYLVTDTGANIQYGVSSVTTIIALLTKSVYVSASWQFVEGWEDGLEYAAFGAGVGAGVVGAGYVGTARASTLITPAMTWSLASYAEDLIANPRGRTIYRWDPANDARAQVLANAPTRVDYAFVTPERFLVALGTIEYGGSTYDPMLVRWPDQNDITVWTPSGTNSSRFQVLGTGSRLIAGAPSRAQSLLWTDSAFYAMRYLGDLEFVYGFELLGTSCGLIGPHAWAEKDGIAFWQSLSGEFLMYDGSAPRALDCPVLDAVLDGFRFGDSFAVYCGVNHQFDEAWWWYPSGVDTPELSKLVIYNYRVDKWFLGDVARTSWVRKADDSRVFGVSPDGVLYEHETGRDRSGSGQAFIETSLFDIDDGDRVMKVRRVMLDRRVDSGSDMDLVITSRRWPFGEVEMSKRLRFAHTASYVDTRIAGKQIKLRFEAPTATTWWRQGDVRVDAVASGRR